MSERNTKLTTEVVVLEGRLEDACELLQRVLTALDEEELDLGGRVPFDPDEIRKFLE